MHQQLPNCRHDDGSVAGSDRWTPLRRARYTLRQGVTSRPRSAVRDRHVALVDAGPTRYPARTMTTLLDLLDAGVTRYGDRGALALRLDDGSTTGLDLPRARPALADRRLAPAGPRPRARRPDPDLVAVHARSCRPPTSARWRRGLVLVPLDLRMSPDAVEGIVKASGARHLILGTGRDAPDPREAGLERFPTTTVEALCADRPRTTRPSRPTGRLARRRGRARPSRRSSSSSSPPARRARRRA